MTARKQDWRYVDIWDQCGEGRDLPFGENARRVELLDEYRTKGSIAGAFLCTEAEAEEHANDDNWACDAGPKVEEINWRGFAGAKKRLLKS
jgi:hypothetical protein